MTFDPYSSDPFSSDPELEAMAREFRKALREEQEEIEAISSETLESEIDMSFAFLELLWNGAQTRVAVGERFFEGYVTHVGKNFVQLVTAPGTFADIHIPFISNVFVVDTMAGRGRSVYKKDPRTLIARMRELAGMPMQEVEIGGDSSAGITGILRLVRSDHVVVSSRDKREWMVPLHSIGYCLTRPKTR